MKIKIKICGIKKISTLKYCNNIGVDYFGLIFFKKSPRNIDIKTAVELINYQKKQKIEPVGVFSNHDFDNLIELIQITNLKNIQLHGNESDEYIFKLKKNNDLTIIKSIGIQNAKDLNKIHSYSNNDYFLFDYKPKKNQLPGGNALSFDWSLLHNLSINKPWFISGGIKKDNIGEIIENLNPYGIDISSGVEDQPGIKNNIKIKQIIEILND